MSKIKELMRKLDEREIPYRVEGDKEDFIIIVSKNPRKK